MATGVEAKQSTRVQIERALAYGQRELVVDSLRGLTNDHSPGSKSLNL
jgi:hypothetical protein